MTIRKGVAVKTADQGGGFVETITASIVEKTQGGYAEILANRQYVLTDNGTPTIVEDAAEYKLYVGKTVEQVLAINGVSGSYTWTTPLAEVS